MAGWVGLLSMVMLLAIVGLTSYSNLTKQNTTAAKASSPEVSEANLGLTVTITKQNGKFEVSCTWQKPDGASDDGQFAVTIKRADGSAVFGGEERLVSAQTTTKTFSAMDLSNGEYYVLLRYIPKKGMILGEKKAFSVNI